MTQRAFKVQRVEALPEQTLRISFADGKVLLVGLQDTIKRLRVLSPLKNPDVFKSAMVGEHGYSVIWPENENLELAGDNLRALGLEQSGGSSHGKLWEWMDRNDLTLDEAAHAIGISRRMLAYYRSGEKPVPKTVELACVGWENSLPVAAH